MLLNFGILLVALIIYLVCNPGSVSAFIENGANGVKEYNEQNVKIKFVKLFEINVKNLLPKAIPKMNAKLFCFIMMIGLGKMVLVLNPNLDIS